MNQSVSSYAPKNNTFSKSTSLNVRITIAGTIQVAGYYEVWRRIFDEFQLQIDDNLKHVLKQLDAQNQRNKERHSAKDGKRMRN